MRYLYLLMIVALLGACGSGEETEATGSNRGGFESNVEEVERDWMRILNCDDIDGVMAKGSPISKEEGNEHQSRITSGYEGFVKFCNDDGKLSVLKEYKNRSVVSVREYSYKNDFHYLDVEKLYSNGLLQRSRYYRTDANGSYLHSENHYSNGKPNGIWREWSRELDSNGNHLVGRETEFSDSILVKITEWRANGVLAEVREFEGNSYVRKKWYDNKQLEFSGRVVNGKKEGVWKFWHSNGQLSTEVLYENEKVISSESWEEDGNPK